MSNQSSSYNTADTLETALRGEPWQAHARCRGIPPGTMFPDDRAGEEDAKAVCRDCPVRRSCLDYALRTYQHHGVWGGATEAERETMRRQRLRRNQQERVA